MLASQNCLYRIASRDTSWSDTIETATWIGLGKVKLFKSNLLPILKSNRYRYFLNMLKEDQIKQKQSDTFLMFFVKIVIKVIQFILNLQQKFATKILKITNFDFH